MTWRLHRSCEAQAYLLRPEIAAAVVETLHFCENRLEHFKLWSFVVMSNHVHVLIDPHRDAASIMQSLKGYSAKRANELLDRTGHPFWTSESFDHWMRDETEFRETVTYIEENSVRAGIVKRAADYRWSSAWERAHPERAQHGA